MTVRRLNRFNAVDLQSGLFGDIPQPFDRADQDRFH
jgi:hypothetical protein